MAESLLFSPEAPLLGELSSVCETERLYRAEPFHSYTLYTLALRCSSSGSSPTGGCTVCRGGEMGFSIST